MLAPHSRRVLFDHLTSEISYPVAFPTTSDFLITTIFTRFNRDLKAWGYLDDPRFKFDERIVEEYAAVSADPEGLDRWIQAKEEWLNEGDRILQAIEDALFSDLMVFASESRNIRRNSHRVLCSTALSIQYMMVVVEYRLDELDARRRARATVQ